MTPTPSTPAVAGSPRERSTALAVDTSVAVAFLDAGHTAHRACVDALGAARAALAGHAAFESLSVLTRLPGPAQVTPADAATALRAAFPEPCWLSAEQQSALLGTLGEVGLHGGMVYDALVGESARANGRTLLTRDRRAVATYEFLGVSYSIVA